MSDELSAEELEAAEAERARQEEFDQALLWVLSDKRGRKVMWWILGLTGLFQVSFTGNSQTFFNEGARNLGLRIMAELMRLEPDSYAEMYKEVSPEE